jgi:hypothetical protein
VIPNASRVTSISSFHCTIAILRSPCYDHYTIHVSFLS